MWLSEKCHQGQSMQEDNSLKNWEGVPCLVLLMWSFLPSFRGRPKAHLTAFQPRFFSILWVTPFSFFLAGWGRIMGMQDRWFSAGPLLDQLKRGTVAREDHNTSWGTSAVMPPTRLRPAQESAPRPRSVTLNLPQGSQQSPEPPPEHLFIGWAMGVTSAALKQTTAEQFSSQCCVAGLADQKPHRAQPQQSIAAWNTLRTSRLLCQGRVLWRIPM